MDNPTAIALRDAGFSYVADDLEDRGYPRIRLSQSQTIQRIPAAKLRVAELVGPVMYAQLKEGDRSILAVMLISFEPMFRYFPGSALNQLLSSVKGVPGWLSEDLTLRAFKHLAHPVYNRGNHQLPAGVFLRVAIQACTLEETISWWGRILTDSRVSHIGPQGFAVPNTPDLLRLRLEISRAFERQEAIPVPGAYLEKYKQLLQMVFLRECMERGPAALDRLPTWQSVIDFLKLQLPAAPLLNDYIQLINTYFTPHGERMSGMYLRAEQLYPRLFNAVYDVKRPSRVIILSMIARWPLMLWNQNPKGFYVTMCPDEQTYYEQADPGNLRQHQWVTRVAYTKSNKPQSHTPEPVIVCTVPELLQRVKAAAVLLETPEGWINCGNSDMDTICMCLRMYRWAVRYRAYRLVSPAGIEELVFNKKSENDILKAMAKLSPEMLTGYMYKSGLVLDWPLVHFNGIRDAMVKGLHNMSRRQQIICHVYLIGLEVTRLDQCSVMIAMHDRLALGKVTIKASHANRSTSRFLRIYAKLPAKITFEIAEMYTETLGFRRQDDWITTSLDLADELSKTYINEPSHWDVVKMTNYQFSDSGFMN